MTSFAVVKGHRWTYFECPCYEAEERGEGVLIKSCKDDPGFTVTLFHGHFIPSNSHSVPQNSQFVPWNDHFVPWNGHFVPCSGHFVPWKSHFVSWYIHYVLLFSFSLQGIMYILTKVCPLIQFDLSEKSINLRAWVLRGEITKKGEKKFCRGFKS